MISAGQPLPPAILLIYDKDCPVCLAYSQMVRIRQRVGELQLINTREDVEYHYFKNV